MKNLFTKNIWAVACLSCLAFIGTSCNESIDVEAVYITAAEKTPITTFSATNNNDELEKVLRLTREIVEGERITCLMITHNMKNALELGSRTFMMDAGRVVLDIGGEERKGLTVDDLLERFRAGAGKNLDNDRILLSND